MASATIDKADGSTASGPRQTVATFHSRVIDAPILQTWSKIRSFGGIRDWMTMVEVCEIVEGVDNQVGCVRLVGGSGPGAHAAHERLLAISDKDQSMTYSVVHEAYGRELPWSANPFPSESASGYEATISLYPITQGDKTYAAMRGQVDIEPAAAAAQHDWFNMVYPTMLSCMAVAATGKEPDDTDGAAQWRGFAVAS